MLPVIGVMPLWDDEKESVWMLPGYLEGIKAAGGLPLILPFTSDTDEVSQLADICSGFLFTGGHDVSPSLYGEADEEGFSVCCPKRDAMESAFLDIAIKKDIPLLGICRGIQFINAALGGTLYRDLPSQRHSDTEHHQKPPYDIPVHKVTVKKGSPLYTLTGADSLNVNSYHHQAIKDVSPLLTVMALSEDGLAEAVYSRELSFLWAVQWHPEFSCGQEISRKIFSVFVSAAKKKMHGG